MNKCNTVIFDLDGTLLDTLADLTDSVNEIMRQYGQEQKTLEQIRQFVGNGIRKLIERCLSGGEAHPQFEEIFQSFREYYTAHCQIKTGPYPGIMHMLERLKAQGYRMAIVSNKNAQAVVELNEVFFHEYITIAVGVGEGVAPKPAPDTVNQVLLRMHCQREDAVYVGDSEVDRATAENSGLPCISVSWGFRDRELLESLKPDALIDAPEEIFAWLENR